MEETKTTLQKIVEQKADQIRMAIEQTIDDGAEIVTYFPVTSLLKGCTINGAYLQMSNDKTIAVVLNFRSEKIAKLFEPSKDDLEKLAEQKRHELEEIEKQIKEREAQQ